MANPGYVLESAVVPGSLDAVWDLILPMTFKFTKAVIQGKKEEGDGGALGQYSIAYADNTVQTVRITEISERLPNKRILGMEFVMSDPPVSYSGRMDTITLTAVTHGSSQVFIEYSSDFTSDATMEVLEDSKFKKREFFDDLSAFMGTPASFAQSSRAVTTSTFETVRKATGKVRPPASHGCKPVEVVPGVWTAHFHDIEDAEALKKASPGVNLVINCAPDKCATKAGSYGDGIEVVVIDLLDDPEVMKKVDAMPEGPEKEKAKAELPKFPPEESAGDAKKDFDRVIEMMEKTRKSGGASMVHCHASLSRSAAFVVAYLMKTEKMTAVEAVKKMKTTWDAVWPNDTFVRQLCQYEIELNA